jgi:protein O-mannosyl-transferase
LARRDIFICFVLLIVTLGVYSQVSHFEFVNYDDPDYSTDNLHIRTGLTLANVEWAFTSSYAANWIPLTWISHMLDRQLFGLNPGRYHQVNLALHLLSTLLLFALFRRMTKASVPSAILAFVFALHPLHIESVAWIAERKDVLSALFWFLTMWAYLNYVARPAVWRYLLMALVFSCALMSKSMAVTLPFALLLLDVWPLRRFTTGGVVGSPKLTHGAGSPKLTHGTGSAKTGWGLVLEKLPLIALAIAASTITFMVQRGGGAVLEGLSPALRIENALVSYVVYLLKFVWPSDLAVFYPFAPIPLWQAAVAAVVLAAITAFAILRRTTRPYFAVGWFWYLGTLLPVIGLIQVGVQSHADRYTYIPLIGITIILAWAMEDLVAERKWMRPPLSLLTIAICGVWAIITWRDLKYWHDSTALFERAIAVTPDNYVAYGNLGAAFRTAGNTPQAIFYYERALEIKPHFANAEDGLGEALLGVGRVGEAFPHLTEAVRLEPQSVTAHINLGAAFSKRGKPAEAESQYRAAIQLDSDSAVAHTGLGVALAEQDRVQEALPQLYEAVRINPNYADGHYNLGRVLGLLGRSDEAMTQFLDAIRLEPSNAEAHYNLGVALASRDRMRDAADEFRIAVDYKPDYVNARFNYASALANLEHYDEAIPQFQAILRLKPDFEPARASLAQCLELRKHPGAIPSPKPAANPGQPPVAHPQAKPADPTEAQPAPEVKKPAKAHTRRSKSKRTKTQ